MEEITETSGLDRQLQLAAHYRLIVDRRRNQNFVVLQQRFEQPRFAELDQSISVYYDFAHFYTKLYAMPAARSSTASRACWVDLEFLREDSRLSSGAPAIEIQILRALLPVGST